MATDEAEGRARNEGGEDGLHRCERIARDACARAQSNHVCPHLRNRMRNSIPNFFTDAGSEAYGCTRHCSVLYASSEEEEHAVEGEEVDMGVFFSWLCFSAVVSHLSFPEGHDHA